MLFRLLLSGSNNENKMKKIDFNFINTVVALCAILLSVCALYLSVKETRILTQQLKASMYPYVTNSKFYNSEGYGIRVKNSGNGLAKIESYQVKVGKKIFTDWKKLISELTPDLVITYSDVKTSGNIEGEILTPNEEVVVIFFNWTEDTRRFQKNFDNLEVEIVYSSLLDEKWENITGTPVLISD